MWCKLWLCEKCQGAKGGDFGPESADFEPFGGGYGGSSSAGAGQSASAGAGAGAGAGACAGAMDVEMAPAAV